jgi:hypothetical protein
MPPRSRSKQKSAAQKRKRRDEPESEGENSDTNFSGDDVQALDSDNLDDDDADTAKRGKKAGAKRKKDSSSKKPKKRRKEAASDEEESDLELKEGQEVVGKIVRAPKTGQGGLRTFQRRIQLDLSSLLVPPGQISQNTFDFLNKLKEPECNDREWLVPSRGCRTLPLCSPPISQVQTKRCTCSPYFPHLNP